MKACPVQITITAAHSEKNVGGGFESMRFVLFGAPSLTVKTEITDLGPDLAAKIAAARAQFFAEKGEAFAKYDAVQRREKDESGTTASVRCLAPRKPAGFADAVRGWGFEAVAKPTATV